jgi:hypothetical protein
MNSVSEQKVSARSSGAVSHNLPVSRINFVRRLEQKNNRNNAEIKSITRNARPPMSQADCPRVDAPLTRVRLSLANGLCTSVAAVAEKVFIESNGSLPLNEAESPMLRSSDVVMANSPDCSQTTTGDSVELKPWGFDEWLVKAESREELWNGTETVVTESDGLNSSESSAPEVSAQPLSWSAGR